MALSIARRQFLVRSTAVSAWLLSRQALSQPEVVTGGCPIPSIDTGGIGGLSLSVHPPEGGHYRGDLIVTITADGQPDRILKRGPGQDVYVEYMPRGVYGLSVEAPNSAFQTVRRQVTVADEVLMVSVYLGKEGWPWFRIGSTIVPFEPSFDKLAIAFTAPIWRNPTDIFSFLGDFDRMGLVPYYPSATDNRSFVGAGGMVVFLRSKSPGKNMFARTLTEELPDTEDLFKRLRKLFPRDKYGGIRLTVPIDARKKRLKLLDSQFVVQFGSSLPTDSARKELALSWGATAEPVPYLEDYWFWRFATEHNYWKNLHTINALVEQGHLVSGEPDLIVELVEHGCNGPTDDPWYVCQDHIKVQNIALAWTELGGKCGTPNIVVATIDQGVNLSTDPATAHPDVNQALTVCVNLENMILPGMGSDDCSSGPYTWFGHGMGVYGIISATPDNKHAIVGIAPDVNHVAIRKFASMSLCAYAVLLRWVGGIAARPIDNNGQIIWPAGDSPMAHIINCSHGIEHLNPTCSLQSTYKRLVKDGRGGLGAIVVYSAGEANGPGGAGADVQGVLLAAMSPYPIIVGNTAKNITMGGQELHDPTSNFGSRLDLCAFGGSNRDYMGSITEYSRGAPSLSQDNSPGWYECDSEPKEGIQLFDRTSAAAPMVSGVAALILSANDQLKWKEVRHILRAAAFKVDPSCSDPQGRWKKWTSSGWTLPPLGQSPVPGVGWRSDWYGYGRLDALAAVKKALATL